MVILVSSFSYCEVSRYTPALTSRQLRARALHPRMVRDLSDAL